MTPKADSVPVNVRFCWRYAGFFSSLRTALRLIHNDLDRKLAREPMENTRLNWVIAPSSLGVEQGI